MMQARWSPRASDDFETIYSYLDREAGPRIALSQCSRILEALLLIQQFPESGEPLLDQPGRKLLVSKTPYAIYFRIQSNVIEIATIRHGARRPLKRLPKA